MNIMAVNWRRGGAGGLWTKTLHVNIHAWNLIIASNINLHKFPSPSPTMFITHLHTVLKWSDIKFYYNELSCLYSYRDARVPYVTRNCFYYFDQFSLGWAWRQNKKKSWTFTLHFFMLFEVELMSAAEKKREQATYESSPGEKFFAAACGSLN